MILLEEGQWHNTPVMRPWNTLCSVQHKVVHIWLLVGTRDPQINELGIRLGKEHGTQHLHILMVECAEHECQILQPPDVQWPVQV